MAKSKPTKLMTKKHIARLERERRQALAITYTAVAVIVIAVFLVLYGLFFQKMVMAGQPVARVGKEVITTREFQARVRLTRQQMINSYIQYYQFAQFFGMDPSTDPTFSQQLGQIENQLNNPQALGKDVLDGMIDEILTRQEAAKQGIVVTDAEVKKTLHDMFAYFPNGTPTPTLTPTAIAYSTFSPAQLALVTLTPTFTPFPTFTPAPTATPDLTTTPTVIPSPTAIPSPTPTATPYTLEGFQKEYKAAVESFAPIGMNEKDYRKLFENRLYRERMYELITADVPHEQDQVWARHILVADEKTALMLRSRLAHGGDWMAIAAQYSLDPGSKDKGGDLGWFKQGSMVAEFDQAAFGLGIGEISRPVQTQFGWHIIQVLGHEARPMTADQYKQACDAKFTEWLAEIRKQAAITIYDYWAEHVPADPTLQDALGQMQQTQP